MAANLKARLQNVESVARPKDGITFVAVKYGQDLAEAWRAAHGDKFMPKLGVVAMLPEDENLCPPAARVSDSAAPAATTS